MLQISLIMRCNFFHWPWAPLPMNIPTRLWLRRVRLSLNTGYPLCGLIAAAGTAVLAAPITVATAIVASSLPTAAPTSSTASPPLPFWPPLEWLAPVVCEGISRLSTGSEIMIHGSRDAARLVGGGVPETAAAAGCSLSMSSAMSTILLARTL